MMFNPHDSKNTHLSKKLKLGKKILLAFGIFLPVITISAATIGVRDSGIDWDASTLTIAGFTAADSSITAFNCFGMTVTGGSRSLGSIVGTSTNTSGTVSQSSTCRTAGDYTFDLKLIDKAGNETTISDYKLSVFPSDATNVAITHDSVEGCETTEEAKIADGNTDCKIDIAVTDQYGNLFGGFNGGGGIRNKKAHMDVSIAEQQSRTSFDYYTADAADLFRDGLTVPSGVLDQKGHRDVLIKSIAPSIKILEGTNPKARVSRLEVKPIDLDFELPAVANDGTLLGTKTSIPSVGVNLSYTPWVKALLLDPDGDVNKGLEKLEVGGDGAKVEIDLTTNTAKNLPSNLSTILMGIPPTSVGMMLGDTVDFDTSAAGPGVDLSSGKTFSGLPSNVTTHPIGGKFLKFVKASGISGILDWGLTTKISHKVSGKNITYPGGNLGGTPFTGVSEFKDYTVQPACLYCDEDGVEGSITFVGADIEGQVRASQDIFGLGQKSGDGSILTVGGLNAKDSREEITQSAYALYRGVSPINTGESNVTLSGIDFDKVVSGAPKYPTKVAYYKGGTVSLSGEIKGVGTIIIEDGNLVIDGNMHYDTANPNESSLGVILINSKFQGKPDNTKIPNMGNIFVRSDVQKIVGTYFADGSLLSVSVGSSIDVASYNYPVNPETELSDQLLLNGIIFSYNTLGGSEILNDNDEYFTPWGTVGMSNRAVATKYDLHHIRRYDKATVAGSCVTDTNNGSGCDTNNFAFIIRPDGKVKNQTPPGFSSAATSYR